MTAGLRSVIGSLSSLWGATVLSAALGFLGQVLLARSLTVDAFGVLNGALATVFLCAGLAGLGVAPFWLRIFAVESEKAIRWIRPSLALLLPACSFTMALIAGVTFAVHGSDTKSVTTAFLLPIILFHVTLELSQSLMQVKGRYISLAGSLLITNSGRLLAGLLALFFDIGLYWVALTLSIYYIIASISSSAAIRQAVLQRAELVGYPGLMPSTDQHGPSAIRVLLRSLPFALTGVSYLILGQGGLVMTAFLGTESDAGCYSAAFFFVTAAYLIPGVAFARFLHPQMHVWAEHDPQRFYNAFRISTVLAIGSGTVAFLVPFALSQGIISVFFGQKFAEASGILKILSFAIVLRFVSASMSSVLITRNYHRYRITSEVSAATFCVIFAFVFFDYLGVYGVAISTVIGEFVLAFLYGFFTLKYIFPRGRLSVRA